MSDTRTNYLLMRPSDAPLQRFIEETATQLNLTQLGSGLLEGWIDPDLARADGTTPRPRWHPSGIPAPEEPACLWHGGSDSI